MYAVPGAAYVSDICRGAGVWRGAFFFGALRVDLGTPEDSFACEVDCDFEFEDGSCRRELNEEMNSIDWGDSPSRLLKCSAASSLERLAA